MTTVNIYREQIISLWSYDTVQSGKPVFWRNLLPPTWPSYLHLLGTPVPKIIVKFPQQETDYKIKMYQRPYSSELFFSTWCFEWYLCT